jgi:hypothetical protein
LVTHRSSTPQLHPLGLGLQSAGQESVVSLGSHTSLPQTGWEELLGLRMQSVGQLAASSVEAQIRSPQRAALLLLVVLLSGLLTELLVVLLSAALLPLLSPLPWPDLVGASELHAPTTKPSATKTAPTQGRDPRLV